MHFHDYRQNVSCKWSFGECRITLNIAEGVFIDLTDMYQLFVFETIIFKMQLYLHFHRKCFTGMFYDNYLYVGFSLTFLIADPGENPCGAL